MDYEDDTKAQAREPEVDGETALEGKKGLNLYTLNSQTLSPKPDILNPGYKL